MGVYYVLVLTRGAMEPWSCTPYWCSSGEPGNKARPGIVLRTGDQQGNLGNETCHGHVLCTGAHQGSHGAMVLHSLLVLIR